MFAAGDWYADYVNWAVSLGIVNGYGNGKFGPNDQITREQMAVMVNNFIKVAEAKLVISQEEKSFYRPGPDQTAGQPRLCQGYSS
jgi:hypothetical protein